jgi:hypothetical protein
MEVHAKWYPKCPHVLLLEGPDYVRNQVTETKFDSKSANSQDPLLSAAAQSCLFVGFPNTLIRNAIQIFWDKFERNDYTGKDLCEILLELEDDSDDSKVADKVEDSSSLEDEVSVEQLLDENNQLRERITCKICCDRSSDSIILPCGHIPACAMCSLALTKCPICRGEIKGLVKARFSS